MVEGEGGAEGWHYRRSFSACVLVPATPPCPAPHTRTLPSPFHIKVYAYMVVVVGAELCLWACMSTTRDPLVGPCTCSVNSNSLKRSPLLCANRTFSTLRRASCMVLVRSVCVPVPVSVPRHTS